MFRTISNIVTTATGRWVVCAVWVVLALALLPVGGGIADETQNDTQSRLPEGAESGEVSRLLNERFGLGETQVALLVYRTRGDEPLTAAERRTIAADARSVTAVPLVVDRDVRAPFGPDAQTGLVSCRPGSRTRRWPTNATTCETLWPTRWGG